MPTSVAESFGAAGLTREAVVRWGTRPSTSNPGVYIVALTDSATAITGVRAEAPLADAAFAQWLRVLPDLTLDGARPTVEQLMNRVRGFWLIDETILYIGLATTLSSRLGAYYKTPIGARRPHAGGYFLKLLSNLEELWVHFAPCTDPESAREAEDTMLGRFCDGVSTEAKEALLDPDHPFPFANLEWPRGIRKAHGLRGAREPRLPMTRRVHAAVTSAATPGPAKAALSRAAGSGGRYRTQRVTAADLRSGQIRIPSMAAAPTKGLFPARKTEVEVTLRGRLASGSWDPRMGPDRERSGVLRLGGAVRQAVEEDEVLAVAIADDGAIVIE
jgi:hypothetical protein